MWWSALADLKEISSAIFQKNYNNEYRIFFEIFGIHFFDGQLKQTTTFYIKN